MKQTKKGFTLVELLVVIAILAILATVSVVGYTAFIQKAHQSNDRTLVAQLNLAVTRVDGGKYETMHEVAEAVKAQGFDVSKMQATAADQAILWDMEEQRFFYSADEEREGANVWVVVDDRLEISTKYSNYYAGPSYVEEVIHVTKGFDGGNAVGLKVSYSNDSNVAQNVIIRMHNGAELTINDTIESNQQYFYGSVASATIKTGTSCFHAHGDLGFVKLEAGKFIQQEGTTTAIVIEEGAVVDKAENATIANRYTDVDAEELEQIKTGASLFAGGKGTETDPFLIATAQQLANISEVYGTFYHFQVADGVSTIDADGIGKIELYGNFDGNNVKIVNLTTALFQKVGYNNQEDTIKISNLEATINNTTDGNGFVRNIFNSGKTTFENVKLHGYIEGKYNMGSFYNYGTANLGGSNGASYTVEFINSTSDVTLVCTTGNGIGGMIGHGYEGEGYTLTIIKDEASCYTGKMYTTNGSDCDSLMAMASNQSNFILNGNETSGYDASFNYASTKLDTANPVKGNNGYTVAPVDGASYFVVSINVQFTAYDAAGVKIPNDSGITWCAQSQKIEATDGKILDAVNSLKIVNDIDDNRGCELKSGVLTVYTGTSTNYLTGKATLQVVQYDANGDILAVGNIPLYTIPDLA